MAEARIADSGADKVADYDGRVEDDGARYKRAVEAELLEDEGIRGARAASYPRKFTLHKYLLLTSICLSYIGVVRLSSPPLTNERSPPVERPRATHLAVKQKDGLVRTKIIKEG
jgi:hypothetical protein